MKLPLNAVDRPCPEEDSGKIQTCSFPLLLPYYLAVCPPISMNTRCGTHPFAGQEIESVISVVPPHLFSTIGKIERLPYESKQVLKYLIVLVLKDFYVKRKPHRLVSVLKTGLNDGKRNQFSGFLLAADLYANG